MCFLKLKQALKIAGLVRVPRFHGSMAPWLMTAGTSVTWQFIFKLETHAGDVRFAKSVGAHQRCLQSHQVIGSSGDSGVVAHCAGRDMGKRGPKVVTAKEAVRTLAALDFAIHVNFGSLISPGKCCRDWAVKYMDTRQQNCVQGRLAVPVRASTEQPFLASHRPFSAPYLDVSDLKGHKAASKGRYLSSRVRFSQTCAFK